MKALWAFLVVCVLVPLAGALVASALMCGTLDAASCFGPIEHPDFGERHEPS